MTKTLSTDLRILIVDDHAIFIEALVSLLEDVGNFKVIATGSNGSDAVALCSKHPDADLLILDVSMPGMDGIEAMSALRTNGCKIPVLMLTQELGGAIIAKALKAGVSGFVAKTASRDEFLTAINTVALGGEYISSAAQSALMARMSGKKASNEKISLTRAELEVLRHVVNGKTTNEIAEALFISPYTAETHRRNILQKLNLRNVAALVRYALENGLVDE